MRTFDLYWIFRFLSWSKTWLILAGLIIAGLVVQAFGIGQPDNPADLVCIGANEYDISDEDDRQQLLSDLAAWPSVPPSKVLQRPPCDMSGSPVSQETINKILG